MQFPATQASIHIISNGLTVIFESDPSAPVISTQAWVKTGSIHEGIHLGSGLSHLVEHMVFKGTKNYDQNQISDIVQSAGGEWNAYTTFDRTVYYIDGLAKNYQTFLKVLTEMVFKPTFPREEFEKEKDVIRREIDMGKDDPNDRNTKLLYETIFANDPRKYPIIGNLDLFNSLTYEEMVNYHRDRYTPKNTFLSISGDFKINEMICFLEKITTDIPRGFTKDISIFHEPPQMGQRIARDTFSIPTSKLTLAWQCPELKHADTYALDLLATILGSGRSSKLYRNIRENTDLCHHIGAWHMAPPHLPGLFAVSAIVDFSKRNELEKFILAEIAKIITLDHSLLTKEIHKAVRMTLSSQFETLSTVSGRASDLASNWHETQNLNFTQKYLEKLAHVTPAELQRVASTYLIQSNLTITSLDPKDHIEPQTYKPRTHSRETPQTQILDNGLTLITQKDSRLPTAFISIATLTGRTSETQKTAGINSLLATLMSKGTHSHSAEEIAHTIDSMGAKFSISYGNNTTLTSASCLSPNLEQTLNILADILQNPALPNKSFQRERKAMIAAIQEQEENPLSVAFKKTRSSLFGNEGYGLPSIGTEQSLLQLTPKKLHDHHQQYFTAKNTVISIAGDINPTKVTAIVNRLFSKMPEGQRLHPRNQTLQNHQQHHLHRDKKQAVLVAGFHGPNISSPDTYALDLIIDYCSDMAGPLFSKIREDLGLAYYVSVTQFLGINAGMIAFYLGTAPEQLKQAKQLLLKEIQKIAKQGIPENKLEQVKTSWLSSYVLANQKIKNLCELSAIDSILGFQPDHHLHTPDHIRNLTAEEIKTVANKYLGINQPTIVTVTPQ